MAIASCLTVIKLGGRDIFESEQFYQDIVRLVDKGEKIILVAGGSHAIEKMFAQENQAIKFIVMANSDKARFCGQKEMDLIEKAYKTIVFPEISKHLSNLNLRYSCLLGADNRLITGEKYPALKVKSGDKFYIERESMVGNATTVDLKLLSSLIKALDVLVIAPPIAWQDNLNINVDADMLAATIAAQANADYLHFLTKSNGILKEIENPNSTVNDLYINEETSYSFIQGRMKQKMRAAVYAVTNSVGAIFTTISSSLGNFPLTKMDHGLTTHFWKIKPNSDKDELLIKMLHIPSISRHEDRLASYVTFMLQQKGIKTHIDEAGNIVSSIGMGKKKILLLGHIDTVPGNIPFRKEDEKIFARGAVDAKGTYAAFIEASQHFINSTDIEILLIGGVEEEIYTAKGGEFVRENYSADSVIIGEPSNTTKITLGYRGIFRIEVSTSISASHSASKDYISAPDQLVVIYNSLSQHMKSLGVEDVSLREMSSWYENHCEKSKLLINFRYSQTVSVEKLELALLEFQNNNPTIAFNILCAAPAALYSKTTDLAKSFYQVIKSTGEQPTFVSKTGASFMNRLKKTWDCDMIAYGPGDSSLDHTDHEFLSLDDFNLSSKIITDALIKWSQY